MTAMRETCIDVEVLGSGTSTGVPMIGCTCPVCLSADPRDQRLRPSLLVRFEGYEVLIDTGPDLRQQALRAGMKRLDAVLYTHSHADHILGLDDVRPFNFHSGGSVPIYASPDTLATIRHTFSYAFNGAKSLSSRPRIETHEINGEAIWIHGIHFLPIPVVHGNLPCTGFRFGNVAYLTDFNAVPEPSLAMLRNLDILFLDALRHRPHPMHSTVEESLRLVEMLRPKRAFFTHISHDLPHAHTEDTLPPNVRLAYDGLRLQSCWEVPAEEPSAVPPIA
jgi:phosphoribosyl 1,2-cyclic phosphate phosphodiesterase